MDWNTYLAQLELSDPTLAAYLKEALGGLVGAVPPAGNYITSADYSTLYDALSQQYVGEVLRQYEATLGPSPELYAMAQEAGYLTPEQAQAMQSETATTTGSLAQGYAQRGGLRTLAGPYQAARTQLLEQAFADIQAAAQKASSDAYQLARMTTADRIQALSNAGQLGLGLVNAGVSRRNALTAAEAGGPEMAPPMEVPAPPEPPKAPSAWQQALPALIGAGGPLLASLFRPGAPGPEEAARRQDAYETERARLRSDRDMQANAPEAHPPVDVQEPFGNIQPDYGAPLTPSSPYGYGSGQASNFVGAGSTANPFAADALYSAPNPGGTPFQAPQSSYNWQNYSYDSPASQNNFNYTPYQSAGYEYEQPSYTYQQPSYDFNWGDYNYQPSYDYSSYYDPGSWSGNYSSGYWV